MVKYRISNEAKNDLIRIHQNGVEKFEMAQAEKYFDSLFEYIEIIAKRPFSFEFVDNIKSGHRHCNCGVDNFYFRVNGNFVEIITIIGRQDLAEKLYK